LEQHVQSTKHHGVELHGRRDIYANTKHEYPYVYLKINTLNNIYTIFLILVSVVAACCVDTILIWAVRKKRSSHFSWLIPLALGYTSSVIISILYNFDPRYWSNLARAGIYPLIIAGILTGLAMIYGWIRLAMTFIQTDSLTDSAPLAGIIAAEKSSLDVAKDVEESVWPPPPVKPV
jgi:hypothetical protein